MEGSDVHAPKNSSSIENQINAALGRKEECFVCVLSDRDHDPLRSTIEKFLVETRTVDPETWRTKAILDLRSLFEISHDK